MLKGKKWNLGTAMKVMHDPERKAERQNIARRYPLLATATLDELWDAIEELDFVTCRKIEKVLNGGVEPNDEAEEVAAE